ncbi:MAG: hypothetical protein D8M26_11005 [Ignavibacteriae bacterium]|nr:hypothetical protein [Ignavibacteriota bacterium]
MMLHKLEEEDREIVQTLLKRFRKLSQQREACRMALQAYGVDVSKGNPVALSLFAENQISKPKLNVSIDTNTLRGQVESILDNAKIPMTSREIMENLNSRFNRKYTLSKFSGNFSSMYRKKYSGIKKIEVVELPPEFRTIYILESWVNEDGKLKDSYLDKYYKAHAFGVDK